MEIIFSFFININSQVSFQILNSQFEILTYNMFNAGIKIFKFIFKFMNNKVIKSF